MARGRMLDKSISASYQMQSLPDWGCKCLATWLISHLDKNGVFYGDAPMVRSQVFPLEDITNTQVEEWLQAMENAIDGDGQPLIVRFHTQGRLWLHFPGFDRHQEGLHKDRERTSFPPVPATSGKTPATSGKTPATSGKTPDTDRQLLDELNLTEPNPTEAEPPAALALSTWVKASGGAINPITVDEINDLVDQCEEHRQELPPEVPGADISGDEWVAEAIKETVAGIQKPHMPYTKTILSRWRAEGYKAHPPSRASPRQNARWEPEPPQYTDLQPWE